MLPLPPRVLRGPLPMDTGASACSVRAIRSRSPPTSASGTALTEPMADCSRRYADQDEDELGAGCVADRAFGQIGGDRGHLVLGGLATLQDLCGSHFLRSKPLRNAWPRRRGRGHRRRAEDARVATSTVEASSRLSWIETSSPPRSLTPTGWVGDPRTSRTGRAAVRASANPSWMRRTSWIHRHMPSRDSIRQTPCQLRGSEACTERLAFVGPGAGPRAPRGLRQRPTR